MLSTRISLAYGALLIAVLFAPFGVYHSMTVPYVTGALWGFMLPVGYVAGASGVTVILYPRLAPLRKLDFDYLLMLIGFSMMLSFWLFPREFAINLLKGTNFDQGWVDIDYAIGNMPVLFLSLASLGAGLALKIRQVFNLC